MNLMKSFDAEKHLHNKQHLKMAKVGKQQQYINREMFQQVRVS